MIEAKGLTKTYGSKVAVNDLTFTVRPGVVTGFLGPNGAGKSTTMRMLLGLDTPTSGIALINGQRYADLKRPLTQVGAMLDAKWVHPNRSARNHLRWLAASNGIPLSRVDEVLAIVGLTDVAGNKTGGFSLGMAQRLGLAGALLGDPGVLLFDEPVNGLDPEGIIWVRKFMRSLAAQGRTVLVSSHLLTEMSLTAEHLLVIGRGRLIADASVPEFIANASEQMVRVRSEKLDALRATIEAAGHSVTEHTETTFSGQQMRYLIVPHTTTDEVGALAAQESIPLSELTSYASSLEEAFIKMTGDDVEYHGGVPKLSANRAGAK